MITQNTSIDWFQTLVTTYTQQEDPSLIQENKKRFHSQLNIPTVVPENEFLSNIVWECFFDWSLFEVKTIDKSIYEPYRSQIESSERGLYKIVGIKNDIIKLKNLFSGHKAWVSASHIEHYQSYFHSGDFVEARIEFLDEKRKTGQFVRFPSIHPAQTKKYLSHQVKDLNKTKSAHDIDIWFWELVSKYIKLLIFETLTPEKLYNLETRI